MIKTLVITITLVLLLGLWSLFYLNKQLNHGAQNEFLFEIAQNQSIRQISRNLFKRKMVKSPELFYRYLQFTGKDRQIKKGIYKIPRHFSIISLAELFTSGRTASITVTLPEGRTSWEIYSILKNFFDLDSMTFDSLVHDKIFAGKCGVKAGNLEGYLFPDTYQLPVNPSESEILRILTGQFFQRIKNINPEDSWLYQKYGMTGLITMASIVEEEAAVATEQKQIAGVFLNRLKKGWPLGADPTVRFAIKKLTGPLYLSELNNSSPYNTRKFPGLPPGPISNPGEMAIRAVVSPEHTNNMYFVAKDDGTREHYFSKTLREHNSYKIQRKKNQKSNTPGSR